MGLKRKCSHCGSENSYDEKFCLKCGRKLPKSPIDYYGDLSSKQKENDSFSSVYDDIKNKAINKDSIPKNEDNEPIILESKPEGFKAWWKSKDFITKTLVVLGGIIFLAIMGGVIGSQVYDPTPNETLSNSDLVAEENIAKDNQEPGKTEKKSEIENSEGLKRDVEHWVQEAYSYDQPSVKNLKIDELKSNTEIIVSFDVDWIDVYGDKKTQHLTGVTLVKEGGKWIYPY